MTATETARQTPWRLVAWLVFVLSLTALGYASRLASEDTPDDLAYRWSSSIAAVIQYAVMLGIVLLIARGLDRREVFGLRRPSSWPQALGYTLVALLLIYVFGYVYVLVSGADPTGEQGLVPDGWDSSRAGAFVAFFVVVTVVAPVVEELIYRGLGYALLAPHGAWVAVTVTGVTFGASHGLLVALPPLTVFGLAIGWLRMKTDSVYPTMILHGFFNGTALTIVVAGLD